MSMGITQMNSLLSSQNTMKSMATMNATKTSVGGSARIVAMEIKADKGRGIDTAKKEEDFAAMEERLQAMDENMANSMTELNERIAADNEKIREEEAEQVRQLQKADEKANAGKTEQSGEVSNSDSGVKVTTDPTTGITEPVDVVEFSLEGMEAATAITPVKAATTPAVSQVHTPSTGKVVDKKV